MIGFISTYFISPTLYIPKADFFALWEIYMGTFFSPYRVWWLENFGLVEGSVPNPPDEDIEVYFMDTLIWGIMVDFLLHGDVSLEPPCLFTSPPFNL